MTWHNTQNNLVSEEKVEKPMKGHVTFTIVKLLKNVLVPVFVFEIGRKRLCSLYLVIVCDTNDFRYASFHKKWKELFFVAARN